MLVLPSKVPKLLLMQAVHSGDVSADKDTEAWLSYELANRSSMIDTWTTNREEFLAREGMGKRPSRSHSIISMRDSTPLSPHLQIIDSWDFDVFNLVDQGKEQVGSSRCQGVVARPMTAWRRCRWPPLASACS